MTKDISHYSVMADTEVHGFITVDVSKTLEDALTYRDTHRLTNSEVWRKFMDGSNERVA